MQLTLDLFPLQSIPKEIVVPQAVVDKATARYSGDTLQENKVRGLFVYLNRDWVCTGYSLISGRRSSANLVEALSPEQWQGMAHAKPKQHTRGDHFYTGRQITFRGRSLVLGSRRLTLIAEKLPESTNFVNEGLCHPIGNHAITANLI